MLGQTSTANGGQSPSGRWRPNTIRQPSPYAPTVRRLHHLWRWDCPALGSISRVLARGGGALLCARKCAAIPHEFPYRRPLRCGEGYKWTSWLSKHSMRSVPPDSVTPQRGVGGPGELSSIGIVMPIGMRPSVFPIRSTDRTRCLARSVAMPPAERIWQ